MALSDFLIAFAQFTEAAVGQHGTATRAHTTSDDCIGQSHTRDSPAATLLDDTERSSRVVDANNASKLTGCCIRKAPTLVPTKQRTHLPRTTRKREFMPRARVSPGFARQSRFRGTSLAAARTARDSVEHSGCARRRLGEDALAIRYVRSDTVGRVRGVVSHGDARCLRSRVQELDCAPFSMLRPTKSAESVSVSADGFLTEESSDWDASSSAVRDGASVR